MSRKRRSLNEPDYSWDDQETSKSLFDRLQSELQTRLRKVDDYVETRKAEIEQLEAASRAELQEALKRLAARELEVAERQQAIALETEKLQTLHAEATRVYQHLVQQLPDIHARVQIAAGASTVDLPPPPSSGHHAPPPQQQQQQSGIAPGSLPANGAAAPPAPPPPAAAAQPTMHVAEGFREGHQRGYARPPAQPPPDLRGRINLSEIWGPGPGLVPRHSPEAAVPISKGPLEQPQCYQSGSFSPTHVSRPFPEAASQAFPNPAASHSIRPPQQPQVQQHGRFTKAQIAAAWGASPGMPSLRVPNAATPNCASVSAFAGVDILRSSTAPQMAADMQQNGFRRGSPMPQMAPGLQQNGVPVNRGGPVANGGLPGRGAGRSFPFQIMRGRGRSGMTKQQQAPDLTPKGRAPMDGSGRFGRRGRGRQTPGRGGGRGEKDGDSLDVAVKMLRAQTEPEAAAASHSGGSLANGGARAADRSDADGRRVKARSHVSMPAQPALQVDAPDLVGLLKEQNILQHMALLDPAAPDDSGADNSTSTAQLSELYGKLHSILGRILTPLQSRRSDHSMDAADGVAAGAGGGAAAAERRERYTLCALQCLIEAAGKYETAATPVRWGWCRELQAFVFVFEAANRLVVEKPEYGNASYFFDLEEPLPVAAQVQRLVAVLSVPAVTRGALLTDGAPDLAIGLPEADAAVLRAAGWTPQNGLRALLNFSGERIIHKNSKSSEAETWQLYRDKITKLLSQGVAAGRTFKPVTGA